MADERALEAARILLLLDAPSIGPRRANTLLTEYGTAERALDALRTLKPSPKLRAFLEETSTDEYVGTVERTYALGGDIRLWSDADYPANLKTWDGRPPIIFFKGNLEALPSRALALVGRVDPSPDGQRAATRFARLCVENEIAVISGLAKGIDGASHRAALSEPPGTTFAVLGHGLDFAYPKENSDIYEEITSHGALISQFRTGVGPQRWTFPARNEVMCTLALGTVIVEGKTGCGSIVQADFSFKHGRPVFVLSRNLEGDDTAWAHDLVERGAHVIEKFDQVLSIVEEVQGEVWSLAQRPSSDRLFEPERAVGSLAAGSVGRAALFDIDGVVVDTRGATATALAAIASRHVGRPVTADEVTVTGKPHDALALLGVKNAYGVYRDEYDKEFAAARGDVQVFADVVAALRQLRDKGVRLAAVTGQPARRARMMLPADVRDLFEIFLTYNDTKGQKDVGINIALGKLGVSAQQASFVGDQSTDLDAARKAGVRGIAVLWGFSTEEELRRWPFDLMLSSPGPDGGDLVDAVSA